MSVRRLRGRNFRIDLPDEPRFEAFLAEGHQKEFDAFGAFLDAEGVGAVVPPWHLWRQGTDWRKEDEPPFAVPPRDQWAGIVPTLRLLREEVIPIVGPIEVVSGFRTAHYNEVAGGSPGSRHKNFEAVDVVPLAWWTRGGLHRTLLSFWETGGPAAKMGLGLYEGTRFHVDTWKHRKW